uniref:Arrestin C-terminal-like domain-containing protein n=1 Tax=Sinocyclocheilus anshuiensis TaxID=1608454 RepID=A0A671PR30_9TELE
MSKSIKKLSLHYDPINESNTFTITKEIKVDSLFVKLTGDANASWTTNKTTYNDHERYFKLKQYLIQDSAKKGQCEKNTTLVNRETYGPVIRPGSHVFPFTFQLPQQNMPPSFKGFHVWVKYVLMIKLSRPWKSTSATHTELNFFTRFRMFFFLFFFIQPQSGTQDKKMKLFGSGKMSLAVTAEKTGYMQGETIRVFVDIDNSSSHDVKLKYSLKQQQTFITEKTTKNKLKDKKYIVKETRDRIPSGEKSKFIVDMPYLCTCLLPHDLTVTIENCRILKVQYELKVSLDVSFASDPAVRFPVVILPPEQQFPPYPPYTYPNPTRYFIFNFLIISLIFIENKCLYDVIRDLKREGKKVRQKVGSNPGHRVKKPRARAYPSAPVELMVYSYF